MAQIDYAALVRDRFTRNSRRTVHHTICIDPDLYGDLEEARTALQVLEERDSDENRPKGDRRAGAVSDLSAAKQRVEETLAKVREASIIGVFKVLSAEKQAERYDVLRNLNMEHPDQLNANALKEARQDILLTLDHFEDPDGNRLDMGREELEMLVSTWSQGETISLATRINDMSAEAPDLPKFGRSSQSSQPSDETSA